MVDHSLGKLSTFAVLLQVHHLFRPCTIVRLVVNANRTVPAVRAVKCMSSRIVYALCDNDCGYGTLALGRFDPVFVSNRAMAFDLENLLRYR
jgi:hypothetical protein